MSVPNALQPLFATPRPNRPLRFYVGPVVLTDQPGTHLKAILRLRWLPSPHLAIDSCAASVTGSDTGSPLQVQLRYPLPRWFLDLSTRAGAPLTFSDFGVDPVQVGCPEGFDHVLFHVPNFNSYRGDQIKNTNWAWSGRINWECGEWRMVLDSVECLPALKEKLEQASGFALTHVGRLERVDGKSFGARETTDVLERLSFVLSFVRGAWTSCMCPVAFGKDGAKLWERWDAPRVSAARVDSWFSSLCPASVGAIAKGFFVRVAQPEWWDAITLSLNWYFEANEHTGMIQSSIVLQQNALETLAWTMFVEDGPVSEGGFDKMPAADRIRLMLDRAKIPLQIPATLTELEVVAAAKKWKDGPHALTELRNTIVHPKKRTRSEGSLDNLPLLGHAWRLGQWYLEMVFLWLFEYPGEYQNRLGSNPCSALADRVPWAISESPGAVVS